MLKCSCGTVVNLNLHMWSPPFYLRQSPGTSVLWFTALGIPAPLKSHGTPVGLLACVFLNELG